MMYITMSARFRVGIACAVTALFFLSFEAAAAATLVGPVDTTVDKTAEYTKTVDVSGHTNLTFRFEYDAEALDDGDIFSYGWRTDTFTFSGFVPGADEGVDGDESGIVEITSFSLFLPPTETEIELFAEVDANATSPADEVVLTNLTLTGDPIVQDTDDDGINDDADNCPATPNPEQKDLDGDGVGDDCDDDVDGDGVANGEDNCPATPNSKQEDFDGDGKGDACDEDTDDDGVDDVDDLCPLTTADEFSNWNRSQGRYQWNGTEWESTAKGAKNFSPDMEYTYGCSGTQILDAIRDATDSDLVGHYKHGVTKSILEDWHDAEYRGE